MEQWVMPQWRVSDTQYWVHGKAFRTSGIFHRAAIYWRFVDAAWGFHR